MNEGSGSMSSDKRPRLDPALEEAGPEDSSPPPAIPVVVVPVAKQVVVQTPQIGPVSTLEDMEIQVLKFQHRKLTQSLELRRKLESDLKDRIEQLEKRQTQDDYILNVMHNYWNQLNEDIRILLERFDVESSEDLGNSCNDESRHDETGSEPLPCLVKLSDWDEDGLHENLESKVRVSTRAVAKIIQGFDRLRQRNRHTADDPTTEPMEVETEGIPSSSSSSLPLGNSAKEALIELEAENHKIQSLSTSLHVKGHLISLRMNELLEKLTAKETRRDELQNEVHNLNNEVSMQLSQTGKLTVELEDNIDKYKELQQLHGFCGTGEGDKIFGDIDQGQRNEGMIVPPDIGSLKSDNEELRELASNRLIELEVLNQSHTETLKELEKLREKINNIPDDVIVETAEFQSLQSKYSAAYSENMELRQSLDETKQHLSEICADHSRHIEVLEREEQLSRQQTTAEKRTLEERLDQIRNEYEMERVEIQQNLSAIDENGPLVTREMQNLVASLQNHHHVLKGDAQRFRSKFKEMSTENLKLKMERDQLEEKLATAKVTEMKSVGSSAGSEDKEESVSMFEKKSKHDSNDSAEEGKVPNASGEAESEEIKTLRLQLKKAQSEQREIKLILDMYKGASKEQRDKVALMASERKNRDEMEEVKEQIKMLEMSDKEDSKKIADDHVMKRIRELEQQVHGLQRQLTSQKQDEEALITEMEVTGQAFEEMQEQNSRLAQQLRVKDDSNFKLMSDRLKSIQTENMVHKEREMLEEQLSTVCNQLEAVNNVANTLEVRDKFLLDSLVSMEKEAVDRSQAAELHKRKAIDSAQSAADLKLHLEKYQSQVKDAQQLVSGKTGTLEAEAEKTKLIQEEMAMLRRKLEHLTKIEEAGNQNEVLAEEIREYKSMLTCPSCKVRRKDAVITKCFHVFCFDCLRTVYETRQRKCPKCNATFGANDYHRLYIS